MSASLQSGHIGLEFSVKDKTVDIRTYVIRFFYDKYPLFNPAVLSSGQIEFDVTQNQSFVTMLEDALKTNTGNTWQSTDQSFEITVFPLPVKGWEAMENMYTKFPDFPKTSPERKQYLQNIDADRKNANGSVPEDLFELEFFFSSRNLGITGGESGWSQHPGVKILCTRIEVEHFINQLEKECV